MKHLKKYEAYVVDNRNPRPGGEPTPEWAKAKIDDIRLEDAPEDGEYFCARCKYKLGEKPEYGDECPNKGCDLVVGNKIEKADFTHPMAPDLEEYIDFKGATQQTIKYFANDQKYDLPEEGDERSQAASAPPSCPPGQKLNPKTGKCEPEIAAAAAAKKNPRFAFLSHGSCPPGKIYNPKTNSCDDAPKKPEWAPNADAWMLAELVKLLEKSLKPIAAGYERIISERWKGKADIAGGLQAVLREAKTGDLLRAKDAIRIFFDTRIGRYPNFYFSEKNVQAYLISSDGKAYGFLNATFEHLCSEICPELSK